MPFPVFPYSPLPAGIEREVFWKTDVVRYDSGARQSMTSFVKPLYKYRIPIPIYNEFRREDLNSFWNQTKGMTFPFLMSDPYDYVVGSQQVVNSGVTNGATLYFRDVNSWIVRPNTTTAQTLTSALSGFVSLGQHYSIEQDTGIFRVNTKVNTDIWTTASGNWQYYKKLAFSGEFTERAVIWNIFGTTLEAEEVW
jgi:hypothetical protein